VKGRDAPSLMGEWGMAEEILRKLLFHKRSLRKDETIDIFRRVT